MTTFFQIQIRHLLLVTFLPSRLPVEPPDSDGHGHRAEVPRGVAAQPVLQLHQRADDLPGQRPHPLLRKSAGFLQGGEPKHHPRRARLNAGGEHRGDVAQAGQDEAEP